jgi:mannose-6-phosphate isomerase-like protein (cupin superfamily)
VNKVNLEQKFTLFDEHWTPKIIGETDDQYVKLAKAQGETVWHHHEHEDELFIVFRGTLHIHFRDQEIALGPGELCIVPKGVEHKTSATEEAHFMMIEPKTTAHTGNVESVMTVPTEQQGWI